MGGVEQVFRSQDLSEVRDFVSTKLTPHRLTVLAGREPRFNTVFRALPVAPDLMLFALQYGARVEVRQTAPEDSFFFVRPLQGGLRLDDHGRIGVGSPDNGLAMDMQRLNHIPEIAANTRHRVVRVDRVTLEQHLRAALGHDLDEPLHFEQDVPLEGRSGAIWTYVEWLASSLQHGGELGDLVLSDARRMMLDLLLTHQQHNYSATLAAGPPPVLPHYVRRAEEFIESSASQAITMTDMAHVCGVSVRSLQAGFRRFRGTTPMAFLKAVRLRRVYEDLLAGPGRGSVTDAAQRWGFTHLGNFAAAYRRRYGESPSTTLKRN